MRKPFYYAAQKAWYLKAKGEDGKWKNLRLAKTEIEAIDVWHKMREAAKRANEPDGITVGELLDLYAESMAERVKMGQLAASTLERSEEYLGSFTAHGCIEVLSVRDLKPYHVDEWLSSKTTWNATTRHHGAIAVKRAMKWGVDRGRISVSPVASLTVEAGEARSHLIDQSLHERLLDGASDPRCKRKRVRSFRLVLMALRLSGCRPGEIASMRIEYIQGDRWAIPHHKTRRKSGKPRVVYPCPCLETLAKIAKGIRTSGPLFQPDAGDSWTYAKMRRRFERLKKRIDAGPDCVLYSYRRASITDSLLSGVDVATVAELHGTSIQMIQRHYGHLCQHTGHMRAAARKVVMKRRKE